MNEKLRLKRMEAASPMMFSLLQEYVNLVNELPLENYNQCQERNDLEQQVNTLSDMINWGFEEEEDDYEE